MARTPCRVRGAGNVASLGYGSAALSPAVETFPTKPGLLQDVEARYRDLVRACDGAVIVCIGVRVVLVNDAAIELLGATQAAQILGRPIQDFTELQQRISGFVSPAVYAETDLKLMDESVVVVSMTQMPCRYEGLDGMQIVIRNHTETQHIERKARFLAQYDVLTQIPNRNKFRDCLMGAIARAQRRERQIAVMLIDLDHFKAINVRFGSEAGNHVLQVVASRLRYSMREPELVARVGGNEFALIFECHDRRDLTATVAARVLANLREPINVGGISIEVTASAGIALYPADTQDIDALLQMADLAMCAAKLKECGTYSVYVPELQVIAQGDRRRHERTVERIATVTSRELEVMEMLVKGGSNKSIAKLLGTSSRTVETHRARVMEKMHAASLPDLVRVVLEWKRYK